MTGIALKCDTCGASYGGYHWSESKKLAEDARRIGWTGPLTRESNSDRCPACSAKAELIKRRD